MLGDLLYIWDDDASQLDGGHEGAKVKVGVTGGMKGFTKALDKLVADKKTFSRVLIQTHGRSGTIGFGDDSVSYIDFKSPTFTDKGYEKLFPYPTYIYFDGCNVADGDDGWKFLEYCGGLFLRLAGGVTMGWTSKGINMWSWVPLIGGHTEHLWGDWRAVAFAPGGTKIGRSTSETTLRERQEIRGNVGNKI